MDDKLPPGFVASYSENTNKLKLSTNQPKNNSEICVGTTCDELMGIVVGESCINNIYEAPNGMNLARTSYFYIRSNLRTQNRDPVCLGLGHFRTKISIPTIFNGFENHSQSSLYFVIQDISIDYIVILMLHEDLIPIKFHGGHWSITIIDLILRAQPFLQPKDYRTLITNGSIGYTKNVTNNKWHDDVARG